MSPIRREASISTRSMKFLNPVPPSGPAAHEPLNARLWRRARLRDLRRTVGERAQLRHIKKNSGYPLARLYSAVLKIGYVHNCVFTRPSRRVFCARHAGLERTLAYCADAG